MPRRKLEESLHALADEIGRIDLDERAAREIGDAIQEIRDALDGEEPDGIDALRQRMSDAQSDFGEEYPTLARYLGQISDLLSRIGV